MFLIFHLAPVFDLPVIESTFHAPKCRPDSWLDVAAPARSSLAAPSPSDKLYVGSQTAGRMFRGGGVGGNNFHHVQMRAGKGHDALLN
jgi:hypothetical protein